MSSCEVEERKGTEMRKMSRELVSLGHAEMSRWIADVREFADSHVDVYLRVIRC